MLGLLMSHIFVVFCWLFPSPALAPQLDCFSWSIFQFTYSLVIIILSSFNELLFFQLLYFLVLEISFSFYNLYFYAISYLFIHYKHICSYNLKHSCYSCFNIFFCLSQYRDHLSDGLSWLSFMSRLYFPVSS